MIERIRIQMIKHPEHKLWTKDRNKWGKNGELEFSMLEKGILLKKEPKIKNPNMQRVTKTPYKILRVTDGKIYNNFKECLADHKFCKSQLFSLLRQNKRYQRICEN